MIGMFNNAIPPLTIGGIALTDQYHVGDVTLPHDIIKDIAAPHSEGRDYMIIGNALDDNTSLTITFQDGDETHQNILYEESYANLWQLYLQLSDLLKATPVTECSCHLFTNVLMRVELTLRGGPMVRNVRDRNLVVQHFELKLSKYSGS